MVPPCAHSCLPRTGRSGAAAALPAATVALARCPAAARSLPTASLASRALSWPPVALTMLIARRRRLEATARNPWAHGDAADRCSNRVADPRAQVATIRFDDVREHRQPTRRGARRAINSPPHLPPNLHSLTFPSHSRTQIRLVRAPPLSPPPPSLPPPSPRRHRLPLHLPCRLRHHHLHRRRRLPLRLDRRRLLSTTLAAAYLFSTLSCTADVTWD